MAICVDYADARPGGPQDGDLVAIKFRRARHVAEGGGSEIKWLIARFRFIEGGWVLQYESHDPYWKAMTMAVPALLRQFTMMATQVTHDEGHSIEAIGHVFAAFRMLAVA